MGSSMDAALACEGGHRHLLAESDGHRQHALPPAWSTTPAAGDDAGGLKAPYAKRRRNTAQQVAEGHENGLAPRSGQPTSDWEEEVDVVVCTDSDSEVECTSCEGALQGTDGPEAALGHARTLIRAAATKAVHGE